MHTRKLNLGGVQITLTTHSFIQTRFGRVYVCADDYGEPETCGKAYSTAEEALNAKEMQLRKMFE